MVGAKKRKELAADLRGIFAAPDRRSGLELASCVAQKWAEKGHKKITCHLEEHIEECLFASAARNCGKNVTLLSNITRRGLDPCLVVKGSTTRGVFKAYLEQGLVPTLRPGQDVVMDNLSAHKGGGSRR